MNNIFVYIEMEGGKVADVSLELLTKGRELATTLGVKLEAVVLGHNLAGIEKELAKYGADTVWTADDKEFAPFRTLPHTAVMCGLIEQEKPQIALFGATCNGRDFAPRVSSALYSGLTADCTQLVIGDHKDAKTGKEYKDLLYQIRPAFGGNIMRLLVSSESIYKGTMEFLDWRIYGFFFSFVNVMFRALYIGITRTKVLTLNAIVMAMVNVVLDYALIFGHFGLPALGLKGAAIASVIAEASSLVFFLLYTWARIDFRKYGLNHWPRFDFTLLGRILSISCFTMVQYFLAMATWFVFFVAVERLGQRQLAIANIVRSIYVVMLIPVQSLSTTANSLVSNLIGAGGVSHVMQLMGRIARMSFIIMVVCVAVLVVFPQAMLSVYTNEEALLIESVPSLYVIGGAMLIASVANIYFNGISGTGNTQAALILETATLVIYTSYIFWIGYIVKAPVSVCFSTEVIYYALLLICSVIYLKKAKWQNKKI